jgi:hypothetical protein
LTSAPYASFAFNTAASVYNTISGGAATVAGGAGNAATNLYATVGGGNNNVAGAWDSTVGGGQFNQALTFSATIAGGYLNVASNNYTTVAGGFENIAGGDSSTVGGGYGNLSSGVRAVVGGGSGNVSSGQNATVSGGAGNAAAGNYATAGGGTGNAATNLYATVNGGAFNTAGGVAATVPGGEYNQALGDFSFAAGRRASAAHAGSFVWADTTDAAFASTGTNQFLIRAANGVGIGTASPSDALSVAGSADFSGLVGVGTVPSYGLDVNSDVVVLNGHDVAFHLNNAHRWRLTSPSAGFEIYQVYNNSSTLINLPRLTVADSGYVGIGTTSPGYLLDIAGRTRVRDGGGSAGIWFNTANGFGSGGVADIAFLGVLDATRIGFYGNDPRGGSGWGLTFDTLTGNVGIGTGSGYPGYKLQVNGSVAGVGPYNDISDARYKTNIVEIRHALELIQQLRGVRYDWRQKEFPSLNFEHRRQIGFIAQEVKAVLPEAVSVDTSGVHSVAYSRVIPVLVEGIKEQQEQLRARDARIATLEQQVADLKSRQDQMAAAWEARFARLEEAVARPAASARVVLAADAPNR